MCYYTFPIEPKIKWQLAKLANIYCRITTVCQALCEKLYLDGHTHNINHNELKQCGTFS